MCELLVRVVDKVSKDPEKDILCLKRGDVVTIKNDGHAWSKVELSNPDWRVFRVPGMSVKEARLLLEPPFVLKGLGDSTRRRALRIDLDSENAGADLKKAVGDVSVAKRVNVVSKVSIQSLIVLKEGVSEQERPKDAAERVKKDPSKVVAQER